MTTNFDRLFEIAAERKSMVIDSYSAPMVPIPKNSRWNGLVYLHGSLTESLDESSLNRLVVTSGDFGIAYLMERWAARFVSELFRNYEVCFIGYGINDPILRYMMDALAADRLLGESSQNAWAFGSCEPGREKDVVNEWESKGVSPILYRVDQGNSDHSSLHRSLQKWSEIYRDGVSGKESIIVALSGTRPRQSTVQDDYVSRMLWEISDKSGEPAKRFAEITPVYSLEWLFEAFELPRFEKPDLPRFCVSPFDEFNEKNRFSLINRPSPTNLTQWSCLVNGGKKDSHCDPVMKNLIKWLVRHLNDPRLIVWIAKRGGRVIDKFSWEIDQRLVPYQVLFLG